MKSQDLLPCLEFGASREDAELTVLLMHGLGANGHDFADVAEAMSRAAEPRKWRFILPHAPSIPVTINMGMVMPAWYDILDMSQPREVDWASVATSQKAIEALMEQETAGKIVLAGFSQGAAMALHVGLRNQGSIVGILMMSGYLLASDEHPCPEKTAELPIGLFHGTDDPLVPVSATQDAVKDLNGRSFSPTIKIYPGLEHSVFEEEIRDVFAWLERVAG